jgi:hypothetical protein
MREKIKKMVKVRWSNNEQRNIFLLFLTPEKEKKNIGRKSSKICCIEDGSFFEWKIVWCSLFDPDRQNKKIIVTTLH